MKEVQTMNIIFDLGGVILKGKAKDILEKLNPTEEEYNEMIGFFSDWNDMDITNMSIEEKFNNYNFSDNIKNKSTAFCPLDVIDCSFVNNSISGNNPDNLGVANRWNNIMVTHPITLKNSMFFIFCMLNIPWLIY